MKLSSTEFDGLFVVELDVIGDDRGSFREVWRLDKLAGTPLSGFRPVQQNVSVSRRGVIRGIHAEPWNKLIHAASGSVFVALVDLREGEPTYGRVFETELDERRAVFVPKGFGNSFQVTSEVAAYSYLVDDHWRADLKYAAIAHDDPDLAIRWPINDAIVSAKDRTNPSFADYRGTGQG